MLDHRNTYQDNASNPLVSVIIPTYNRADTLPESIDSVLQQTYSPIEIIVIDDGSIDHTAEVIKPYLPKIRYIKQSNAGLAMARNAGMAAAKGEYFAWLDSDDLFEPHKVAVQIQVMQTWPEVVLCCTDFSAFDEKGVISLSHLSEYYSIIKIKGLQNIYQNHENLDFLAAVDSSQRISTRICFGNLYPALMFGNVVHPPTILMRRSVYDTLGGLDAQFCSGADYEYAIRVAKAGQIACVNQPLLRYRYSVDQMSSDKNAVSGWADILRVLMHQLTVDFGLINGVDGNVSERIGQVHWSLATAYLEKNKHMALTHLVKAIRLGYVGKKWQRVLMKLVLPSVYIRWYRRRVKRIG